MLGIRLAGRGCALLQIGKELRLLSELSLRLGGSGRARLLLLQQRNHRVQRVAPPANGSGTLEVRRVVLPNTCGAAVQRHNLALHGSLCGARARLKIDAAALDGVADFLLGSADLFGHLPSTIAHRRNALGCILPRLGDVLRHVLHIALDLLETCFDLGAIHAKR
ncbi:hypothetical protein G7048_03730 [Diaphorobacter sp. HDW4B]|uniref:hypothetical protein n=1 Tax=Diaphorobacter sp. HDW4B TaxID=2714925 RepID=UPI00140A1A31|nr:hypothetical protein [Diaphorobacter sp. HDW4B]QIL69561.1 hypothetical protein G7048_03730 [Diaphorobacter sp. HDW4B]